ncbi:MAG TPA: hypothetical protein VFA71_03545 [Terriglobales bacterium]|nr:hypothetical protein [Terriglobales bacterium]
MKRLSRVNRKRTFEIMEQNDVPQSRNGKHRKIVGSILEDLEGLAAGAALKIPLKALQDSKENVRAALSRESKKRKITVSTAADAEYLYVWQS